MINKLTEEEMMKKFIEDHAEIAFKYMIWQEQILPNQIFNPDVQIDAEDVDVEVIYDTDPGDEYSGGTSGQSKTNTLNNYGINS